MSSTPSIRIDLFPGLGLHLTATGVTFFGRRIGPNDENATYGAYETLSPEHAFARCRDFIGHTIAPTISSCPSDLLDALNACDHALEAVERFRQTPPVDDDFVSLRNAADALVGAARTMAREVLASHAVGAHA